MGLNAAGLSAILEDGNEAVLWAGIGDGPTAADQTSAQRRQVVSTVASGVITATGVPYAYTGASAAGATHVLLFSASTGGTFYGFEDLVGDDTFTSDGNYQLIALTITGFSPA